MASKPLILIIDDESVNLSLLVGILRDSYRIRAFRSGSEMLRATEKGEAADLILLDITARKKVEHDLATSEQRYRWINENITDAVWVYNFTLDRYTYMSPSIKNLLGKSVEQAIGEKLADSLPPETYAKVIAILSEDLPRFLLDPTPRVYRYRLKQLRRDGSEVPVELVAYVKMNAQNEVEMTGVSREMLPMVEI